LEVDLEKEAVLFDQALFAEEKAQGNFHCRENERGCWDPDVELLLRLYTEKNP
jgi:hypothetical protein